ncbi:MAG TPA: glycoside hydrolase family 9 protein [Polyangiales bacterium]|nr:glycoside hydrolase family 9 protein [Polyangiales bacterium]
MRTRLIAALCLPAVSCLIPATRMRSGDPAAAASDGAGHNLLANATFDNGISLPWSTSFTIPATGDSSIQNDAFCVRVTEAGKNRWDAQFRHREMVIQRGHHYRVSFKAWADKPTRVRPKLGMAGPPYAEYWADSIELGPKPQTFTAQFTMAHADDPTAELAFHAGAELAAKVPFQVCIDDVYVEDPQFTRARPTVERPVPDLLVNQLGYLPNAEKLATLKSSASAPLDWVLLDPGGANVAKGKTRAFGADTDSGETVHVIDFSSFNTVGNGYRLQVGQAESHPFAIAPTLYATLRTDALQFFYHQRSGIDIVMPYAIEPRWVRPAGHLGDKSVPCSSDAGCDYSLDVAGGWYDAGDHGKYVVNAGISVWTLLNLYERGTQTGTVAALGDGRLKLPESGNGVSDLLDEVRWELEWMLKMQVPAGQKLAGMAHHKMHDKAWTELGTAPHEDKQPRVLMAPSTAATLNLAANAAQAARIWRSIDPAFSKRCLTAAQRAYDAAIAHPAIYAPASSSVGGGPYDDKDVSDEFLWASAELLITTGEARYRDKLKAWGDRPLVPTSLGGEAGDAGQHGAMSWQNVEAAAALSLALAPPSLEPERSRARKEIAQAADKFLGLRAREGYGIPFAAGPGPSYPWGSNSFILNNAMVLGTAYDQTKDAKYLAGVVGTMDYLLGNNPLDQSYITGYGVRPLKNPHHRFFSHQIRKDRPEPPPGIVSGGPNTGLQDPFAKGAGLAGRPPQKCFLDHIESFSTNEVTINWNAPLAWVAAFLDDTAAH